MATVNYHLVESSVHVLHAVIAGQVVAACGTEGAQGEPGKGSPAFNGGVTVCGRKGRDWQVVIGKHVRTGRLCRLCLRGLQRAVKAAKP
ncbi:MAG TPA: hypothetical protein VMF63_03490 [Opitutaceae bacterium]|nr:hypothetical protein [Opitutaceae bacterium]